MEILIHMETKQFQDLIREAAAREMSADPENWSESNPLWGLCAVATLLGHDYFGGEILRASLLETQFADSGSHYRNEVADFTEEQFRGAELELKYEPRTREYLTSNANTYARYLLLKAAFDALLAAQK